MSLLRNYFYLAQVGRLLAAGAFFLAAQSALAAPDWAAIEGDLRWPTNYFAWRDALVARFPPERALNVRDFGAKGDGVKDDSKAVQKALKAAFAKQRALHFPAGTYFIGTLADLQPHAFLSIGYEGKPGSLVLTGDGQARLWTTRRPPASDNPYPTSPILRVFAGVTNLLVQGLIFDRSGTPPFHTAAGQPLGNGDQAGALQILPGRGQRGFDYVGLLDCEFVNCHHAFSLYPSPLRLSRGPWTAFPSNSFNLVHIANNRFNYTNQIGGTATWFDGVRLLVVESNRFDGQLDNQIQPHPTLTHESFNRTADGLLFGQCEQLWARGNHIRNGSFELLACTFGYRLYERDRTYVPGEAVVFAGDLWQLASSGKKKGVTPGATPDWRRTATNYSARFVHRFLDNVVDGALTPGAFVPGAYVGLRVDLASLVAVSNRFGQLLEGILQCSRAPSLESGTGFVSAGSVIRGNRFLDCTHGVFVDNGPALVVENEFTIATDVPRQVNDQWWHPFVLAIMDSASGTIARSNVIRLARREVSAPTTQRQWQPWANAAVAFAAGNGVYGCAEANLITNFACGVAQQPWSGVWTLRQNVWSDVPMPWEGTVANVIADETILLPATAPGWFTVANLDRTQPGRGALELTAEVAGSSVRYRFEVELAGPAGASHLRASTHDSGTAGQRVLDGVFCRYDGALLLHFARTNPMPATLRFTTDNTAADCAPPTVSGIRWRWPAAPAQDVPAGLLTAPLTSGLLRLTNGPAEMPLFR